MIDLEFLERLVDLLHRSDANTIEIRKKPWSTSIKVSKTGASNQTGPVTYHVAAANPAPHNSGSTPTPSPTAPTVELDSGEASGGVSGEEVAAPDLAEIKSPMVGTFYAQPEPGAEPYVRVGSRISVGETLCIIEAMKIMNPLDSEVSGVIKECAVEDGQAVEFGQLLFKVDPHG